MGSKEPGLPAENCTIHHENGLHVSQVHKNTENCERRLYALVEIIEEFTFAVIHTKVVVEDCISREQQHLPEPTEEDHQLQRD